MFSYLLLGFFAGLLYLLGWLNYKYVPGMGRNAAVGFRTPWSMQSDANWQYANREAGKAMMVAGLAVLILGAPVLPFVPAGMHALASIAALVFGVSAAALWTQHRCQRRDR